MEYTFFDFLTLIGSLGLFLYGMKVMSEGLQKVAEPVERNSYCDDDQSGDRCAYRSVNYRSYTIFFRNDGDGCQFCKCRLTFFDTVGVGYYGCQCGYYCNGVDNFYFWL